MPFLPNEKSVDRLLKLLGIELAQQCSPQDLRAFGWYQYRDYDHPKTQVATELVADAFLYLCFDQAGAWRRNPKVISAIIAFMKRYYRDGPTPLDLQRLKQVIDAKPTDKQSISNWFHAVYPPDSAPEE